MHEEPEAEVVSDESDSVETDIENTASEVEGVNASTNTEPQAIQHSSETVSNVLQLLGKLFGGI